MHQSWISDHTLCFQVQSVPEIFWCLQCKQTTNRFTWQTALYGILVWIFFQLWPWISENGVYVYLPCEIWVIISCDRVGRFLQFLLPIDPCFCETLSTWNSVDSSFSKSLVAISKKRSRKFFWKIHFSWNSHQWLSCSTNTQTFYKTWTSNLLQRGVDKLDLNNFQRNICFVCNNVLRNFQTVVYYLRSSRTL